MLLFAIKMAAKVIGFYPMTLAFKVKGREAIYTTMMMSTGLTFGSISALFDLTHGYIDQAQYSILVTVVIMTASTNVARAWFQPRPTLLDARENCGPGTCGLPRISLRCT